MPVAAAGGIRLRTRQWGEERPGTPLLLVHGAAAGSGTWLDLGRRLGQARRTLALDLPGHGQSPPLPEPLGLESARDTVGWLSATLGLGRALLVGHSMGGAVALLCALAWPDRVAAVAVLGTGPRLPIDAGTLALLRQRPSRLGEHLARTCYSPETPRELALRLSRVSIQAPPEVALSDFLACQAFDLTSRLGEIGVPALVVGGSDDLVTTPRLATELAEGLPRARLLLLERAGHNLHHEHPEALAGALLGFADEVA